MTNVSLYEILQFVAKSKRTTVDKCFPFCIENPKNSSGHGYIAIVARFGNYDSNDKDCVFYNSVRNYSPVSKRLERESTGFDYLDYKGFNLIDTLNEKEINFNKQMEDLLK